MRIILEGADGTGKTTLANILAHKYGLDICHCTQHDPADFNFYRETMRKENVIWDRHTIGELIYPIVFDRVAKVTPQEAKAIISMAIAEDVKIFVLTCDQEILEKRVAERGIEHEKITENLAWIDQKFKECARWLGVPIIDTSNMTLGQIFNLVEAE